MSKSTGKTFKIPPDFRLLDSSADLADTACLIPRPPPPRRPPPFPPPPRSRQTDSALIKGKVLPNSQLGLPFFTFVQKYNGRDGSIGRRAGWAAGRRAAGGPERLLKNCRNKVSRLGRAKNTAQRVNTIKEDADKALLTFKWENNAADTFRAFGCTLWRLERL